MAISRKIDKKAPSQNPHAFFACEQHGGMHGKPSRVPDRLGSGTMGTDGTGPGKKLREPIYGRPDLSKQ